MPDGGVSWLHSAELGTGETGMLSFSANDFPFLHQLPNELAHGTIADYITHTIHTYNIIIIHAFLLMNEMQMCGRVIFALAHNHIFGSNSAAKRALGLNSLLTYSFTVYYLTLE
jgi:hypothetical protein